MLEALRFGKAVLASNIRVFKEVAGPAGFYVSASDASSIAGGLRKLSENPTLRTKLESHAKAQVKKLDNHIQIDRFMSQLISLSK